MQAENANDEFQLVGLEATIAQDESGDATRAMIESLQAVASPLKEKMRGSMDANEFRTSSELLQALEAGEEVLRSVWRQLHPNRSFML